MKRLGYLILGLFVTGLAIAVVVTQHTSWWQVVVFAIAPDVTLFFGAGPGLERGQLHPRAVPFYNAVHRFWLPAILVAVMSVLPSPGWLAGGLAWIAHIAFDRSLGFGLRSPQGFQRA
ncbi:MAG TPA: DUF4260 family protein [Candidatus Dormibacteraeota bacterium]